MFFSDHLNTDSIILSAKSTNRWDLIRELLDATVKNRQLDEEDREVVGKALIEREKSMSTAIGKGVAIPHCTSNKVTKIIIAMALSETGIDFDSIDNMPVKIAILLLVPKSKLSQHVKTLANIAKIMNNDNLRDEILALKNGEKILETIKKYEKIKK